MKKRSPRKDWGLRAGDYSPPFRWMVDQDYVRKLGSEEKKWLAKFNSEYYGGQFRADSIHEASGDVKRERWRARDSARRDLLSQTYPTKRIPKDVEDHCLYGTGSGRWEDFSGTGYENLVEWVKQICEERTVGNRRRKRKVEDESED